MEALRISETFVPTNRHGVTHHKIPRPAESGAACCPKDWANDCLMCTVAIVYMCTVAIVYKTYDIERRSCNHCYSGKAICITYSECVFLAFVTEHVMRMRHTVICCLPGSTLFFHIIS
jgi:hypothetical protein